MKSVSLEKILLAVLSGLMLTAGFPPAKIPWIHWISLIPLLKALKDEEPSGAFRLGFIAGMSHYLTLLYWVTLVLGHYGGLPFPVSVSILILFCLYLSLYPALFSLLFSRGKGTFGAIFLTSGLWVALEFVRAKILTGFPWCLMGYGQFRNLLLIQSADLFGVYGLSFLLCLVNVTIYVLLFERGFSRKTLVLETALTAFFLSLAVIYGYDRLAETLEKEKTARALRVLIVQGNVDQSVKWNPAYQKKTVTLYETLTHRGLASKPALVVWPETAMPFFFQENTPLSERVRETARRTGADLIFGSPAYERRKGKPAYFNRAFGISPSGTLVGTYDKVHLVPFGEYVPLKRFLFFVNRLVQAAGDFTSGTRIAPIRLTSAPAGILICFEIIFPEIAREQVRTGAEILINLTNDAWFGKTSAPYQHLAMAVFRAVETRRPLIRAANTGFSAFIAPSGKILKKSGLFKTETLAAEIPLPANRTVTPYERFGDLLPWFFFLIWLIKILLILCYNKKFKNSCGALFNR
ncbi:MAG: apolipoprotein N-acyltransferase [Deltaproteobacteria bacterium]|nr:apolipoprotein N-acyltransferase [Deltaproteobacteria bacterium]MBW2303503.1 apolipoprotein N-acyltransferase [Deltaproteobacteria bacterium]